MTRAQEFRNRKPEINRLMKDYIYSQRVHIRNAAIEYAYAQLDRLDRQQDTVVS